MTMGFLILVVLVVLLLAMYLVGYRAFALLLLLALLGLWAYLQLSRRAAVQDVPSVPVIAPSDGFQYPDGHDGSSSVLH